MKKESPLNNLIIRTAIVRQPDVGYIICCDSEKENYEISHAWSNGESNIMSFDGKKWTRVV